MIKCLTDIELAKFYLHSLLKLVAEKMPQSGDNPTYLQNLFFVRRDDPKICWHGFLKPMAALICQGAKVIQRGQNQETAKAGDILLTSVEIPDSMRIVVGENNTPYFCVYFLLERKIFVELLGEMPWSPVTSSCETSANPIIPASPEFIETMYRASQIACDRQDAQMIGRFLLKELHYLLLKSQAGVFLRELYMRGTNDNRIVEAINYLKNNLNRPVSMKELAQVVFMSVSSLHRHFKKVTGYSPLQYHKELRLYEAQRLMLLENERADVSAMAVGYESVTQFNREYKRKFGRPPHQDIMARRAGGTAQSK